MNTFVYSKVGATTLRVCARWNQQTAQGKSLESSTVRKENVQTERECREGGKDRTICCLSITHHIVYIDWGAQERERKKGQEEMEQVNGWNFSL